MLEILGDGTQEKSYLYIDDRIEAVMHLTKEFQKTAKKADVYNVDSYDKIRVKEITRIVAEEKGKPEIRYAFIGEVGG